MKDIHKMADLKLSKASNICKTDKLKKLLEIQKAFGSKFCCYDSEDYVYKTHMTKEFVLCCQDELMEIMNWLPWKHWKKHKKVTKKDVVEIKFEIIDLLHFVLNLMLLWNMDAKEVFQIYCTKNKENIDRQKRGY